MIDNEIYYVIIGSIRMPFFKKAITALFTVEIGSLPLE